ncbi:3-phosphoshikimate 1-carboxyvinyltransferase [Nibricoccus aquaticus]|nr:3-phosphoshikimate 1-carboxyvinyltransferase [Nibricoccus aquaticus]
MSLPDLLPIRPFTKPVKGDVTLPGSKSLTNRSLLLAALCDGPVTLTGALFSEDTQLMATALTQLGIPVRTDEASKTIHVTGCGGKIPAQRAEIFVGLAGTAARFLTAFCAAAQSGIYTIDGVPQMRKRPMKGLFDALVSQGAEIKYLGQPGFFPVKIHAHGLRGGPVEIDATESSQMLSAMLMVAPLAAKPLEIKPVGGVREPFVEMTARLMTSFSGLTADRQAGGTYSAPVLSQGARYRNPGTYAIEPDATASSYFAALPLVTGGQIQLSGLRGVGAGLQGDTQFLTIAEKVGATVRLDPTGNHTLTSWSSPAARSGVTASFNTFSDTFLTLAAISPLLSGPTKITGIAHTRKQETDRVAGMACELIKLGQHVIETEDSLEIHPRPLKRDVEIETYHDHRFAMSFGILGCHDLDGNGIPWLSIKDPACCAKTFPHFFDVLGQLWTQSHSD